MTREEYEEIIHGFEPIKDHPNYGINAVGEVKNFKTGRILKPDTSYGGYSKVDIDGKKYYIHRLVAENFVPNEEGARYVLHRNGNKSDNFFNNLTWSKDLKPKKKNFPQNRT